MNVIVVGFLGSLAAGMMTTVGAIPILVGGTVSRRMNDALLGFAAGVMLAASFFSLIIPSIEASTALYGAGVTLALIAAAGVVVGVVMIYLFDKSIPHEHFITGREGPEAASLKKSGCLSLPSQYTISQRDWLLA